MSYDLFFLGLRTSEDADAFREHFEGRRHYTFQGEDQAWYENEDTGVYFSFERRAADQELAEDEPEWWTAFNLNFFRPHFFAQEALPELLAFVERFGAAVDDPQGDGVTSFSAEGFLQGWDRGNRAAYRVMTEQDFAHFTAPSNDLARHWRWNLGRAQLQAELGEDIFVPMIMYVAVAGAARSAVVWPDAIPVALPRVDLLLMPREELAPRRFFLKKPDVASCPWSVAESTLSEFPFVTEPQPHHRLEYSAPPASLAALFRDASLAGELERISVDSVLDRELMSGRDAG